jgi:F-type H+-transporting ATPase subunit b
MTVFLAEGISLIPDGSLFVHIFFIILMVWLLNRTFYKPINDILERREARIKGVGAGSAADLLQQVDDKTRHYETALRDARTEGYRKMEARRAAAAADRQTQLNSVRTEIDNVKTAQKETIAAQVAESRVTLQAEAQRIAREIGTRILGRAING